MLVPEEFKAVGERKAVLISTGVRITDDHDCPALPRSRFSFPHYTMRMRSDS
jgi:hypothetical protein